MNRIIVSLALALCLLPISGYAKIVEYNLDIARKAVDITGSQDEKITVNGTIPGPTLRFTEGDEAVIHVTNHLKEDTSVHWHGFILPGAMDGSPGFNGFHGIMPGETFTYHFPIRQSGTYWYHSHSMGQEQDGLYGSIIISPKGRDPIKADREYVVFLSDYAQENASDIMGNLKMDSGYYNFHKQTVGDFFHDVHGAGFKDAWKNASDWWQMRMSQADLADVASGYTFLVNGKSPKQNWTGIFKPGERVRLRFINGSAMTFYDVRIPGLKMTVVQADGQDVEPVKVDEFRFGIAETYDVIVQPKDDKAYTIAAEPIDRSGFGLATLASHEGMRGETPKQRTRALLTMADMNMEEMMKDDPNMDMSHMDMESGWAKAGTPPGYKTLDYKDLRYLGKQLKAEAPEREIEVRLGGNMQRFIWTMNGKKFDDATPIILNYGERVRIKYINETMMAHPMHLHGMFMQLENGQPADRMPNKHIIIVPPGQTVSALLTADEPGEWPFHCHLLYHMMSGMMTKLIVLKPGEEAPAMPTMVSEGGHHHAH